MLARRPRARQINHAEGQAAAIRAVAEATASGLKQVAEALQVPGGDQAMKLRIPGQWVEQFGELEKKGNTFVLLSRSRRAAADETGVGSGHEDANSRARSRGRPDGTLLDGNDVER